MGSKRRIKSDGVGLKILEEILYISFVVFGFYLAFLIRFNFKPIPYNLNPYFESIPYIVIISIVIFYIYEIVSTFKKNIFENIIIICICLILIDMATIVIVFFNRGFSFPRSVFLLGFLVQFLLVFITKMIIMKIFQANRKQMSILIIASKEEGKEIAKKILTDKYNMDKIKYICTELRDIKEEVYVLIDNVDKVYIGSTLGEKDKSDIIEYCNERNKFVYLVPSFFEISLVGFKIQQIDDMPLFKIGDMSLTYEERFMKRVVDIVIASMGIIILSPILLVFAIIIKLYDRGPVFFKQERITENNKRFYLYKFRTMIVDAEKHTGPVLATEKDNRITPLGRILRSSRIDEIPQLFNVLKGDMSIVGPRPERPFFVNQYNEEVEGFKYRVFVKAGITGLAQILGTYSTDPETKAKYDLLYIKDYSLFLDIKIIFNTIRIMFMKDSSKGVAIDEDIDRMLEDLDLLEHGENGISIK